MAALWNPRALLGVDPDGPFTCVGTTQRGARCRNSFISNSDLAKASNLLDRMATSDPWDARPHLSYLAEITLCPRWHRKPGYSQVESMKFKWWNIIVSNYPEARPTRPMTFTTSNPEPHSRNTRRASHSSVSSSSAGFPTPPPSPPLAYRYRQLTTRTPVVRGTTPIVPPTPAVLLRTPTDSPERSRASSNVSALSTSSSVVVEVSDTSPASRTPIRSPSSNSSDITSSSASSSAATPAAFVTPPQSPVLAPVRTRNENNHTFSRASVSTAIASSSQTPASTPRGPRTQPANTWQQLTPERPIQPLPCPHSSRRKPLTDECPICNEEMHCPDDAVWCRAQCGTNMHRGCFAPWRRVCLDGEGTVTCPFCRAPWKYEWED